MATSLLISIASAVSLIRQIRQSSQSSDVCGTVLRCIHTGQAETFACDLWDTSPMLYQLSYVVKSIRVGDILELSLVPSISMYSKI